MKNKLFVRTCLALLVTFVFAGCQKEDNDDEPTKTEILTSGQWRISAITANPPLTIPGLPPISDVYAFAQPCFKDDYYVFNKNGTAEINEGATKCDPDDPQTSTVNWALSTDEKEITIDGEKATLLELTSSRMRVNGTVPVQGINVQAEITFTK